jgi:hypothetical protein
MILYTRDIPFLASKLLCMSYFKLGTNYPWVKGIQVCSNKWPGSLQRGNNHNNIKLGLVHLKIIFRTMKPEKLNFT